MMKVGLMKCCVLVCLLFSSVAINAQLSSGRIQAIAYIQEGDAYLQRFDWEKALFSYTNAIQADITFAEAYMKRGQLYERTTHTQEAMQDYNTAIQLNPYVDIYYDSRARIRILSFDYYGAVDDLSKAIDLDESNVNYLKYQVDGFISLGMYTEGLEKLNALNAISMDQNYLLQRKALISIMNNDFVAANDALNKAYEQDDSSYLTCDLFGLIYFKRGQYEEALDWFTKALEIDSTQYISYYNRGITYRHLEDEVRALKDIDKAIALNAQNQLIFYKRALIRKEGGDYEGAIADYDAAILLDPDYAKAIYNRAFTYSLMGDVGQAKRDIDYVINLPENKPEYWNMKGNLMILHGEVYESIACFDRAISYDIDYAEAYYNRGVANLLGNRPIQACQDFERSRELNFEMATIMLTYFCGHF